MCVREYVCEWTYTIDTGGSSGLWCSCPQSESLQSNMLGWGQYRTHTLQDKHTHTRTRTHTHTHTHTHTQTHIQTHTHTDTQIHTHTDRHRQTHTHGNKHAQSHTLSILNMHKQGLDTEMPVYVG